MKPPLIYLDNNATTAVAPEVLEAMLPYLRDQYGNPTSMYSFAGNAPKAMDTAREQVASLIGASPEEIVFTSCGTESDSTAILGAFEAMPEKRHFITSKVEHSAVIAMGQYLERKGYRVTYLDVDARGRISLDQLDKAMTPDTGIVSLMYANNETGTIFPIAEAAAMARERGIVFHVDAVQAAGKIPMNMATLPVNYLAMSGHKLHAPNGSAYCTCGAARRSAPSCGEGTRNTAGGPGPRTCPISSAWARPANWPPAISRRKTRGSGPCVTPWNQGCSRRFRNRA